MMDEDLCTNSAEETEKERNTDDTKDTAKSKKRLLKRLIPRPL